jgi:hypothetical protein
VWVDEHPVSRAVGPKDSVGISGHFGLNVDLWNVDLIFSGQFGGSEVCCLVELKGSIGVWIWRSDLQLSADIFSEGRKTIEDQLEGQWVKRASAQY